MAEENKKIQEIITRIETLTVLELNQLVEKLEDQFGVVAVAPAAVSGAPAQDSPATEEKNEFTVVLTDTGANKIGVIKAIREINNTLGLKEAKDLAESAPKSVLENAKKDEAQKAKEKLEAAGAKVELQ